MTDRFIRRCIAVGVLCAAAPGCDESEFDDYDDADGFRSAPDPGDGEGEAEECHDALGASQDAASLAAQACNLPPSPTAAQVANCEAAASVAEAASQWAFSACIAALMRYGYRPTIGGGD